MSFFYFLFTIKKNLKKQKNSSTSLSLFSHPSILLSHFSSLLLSPPFLLFSSSLLISIINTQTTTTHSDPINNNIATNTFGSNQQQQPTKNPILNRIKQAKLSDQFSWVWTVLERREYKGMNNTRIKQTSTFFLCIFSDPFSYVVDVDILLYLVWEEDVVLLILLCCVVLCLFLEIEKKRR